ncbi:Uncharacterized protein TCM_034362 [Theobroma cacao]|uniref:Uncharacterized protein n=1 Tax=Theobroma cacao TaxID=3641 RepID=A0A061FL72_THECC|nr:Uncharacterized protein TCM_034362 [Theobroma cacao]
MDGDVSVTPSAWTTELIMYLSGSGSVFFDKHSSINFQFLTFFQDINRLPFPVHFCCNRTKFYFQTNCCSTIWNRSPGPTRTIFRLIPDCLISWRKNKSRINDMGERRTLTK